MLNICQNLEQGHLVNGSLGKVIAFKSPLQANQEGVEIAKVEKSKDSDKQRKGKEKYLSNHPSSAGVKAEEEDIKPLINDPRVWPVVRFSNGRELMCMPDSFTAENVRGEVEATRNQVRLSSLSFFISPFGTGF